MKVRPPPHACQVLTFQTFSVALQLFDCNASPAGSVPLVLASHIPQKISFDSQWDPKKGIPFAPLVSSSSNKLRHIETGKWKLWDGRFQINLFPSGLKCKEGIDYIVEVHAYVYTHKSHSLLILLHVDSSSSSSCENWSERLVVVIMWRIRTEKEREKWWMATRKGLNLKAEYVKERIESSYFS